MCGICGQILLSPEGKPDPSLVKRMMATMDHRGPDEDGMYTSGQAALGHKRLSIIDLSGGKQPISNEDNSIWVVFNGEIYNFKDLRTQLVARGHVFRTHTDTEVIVHLYEEFGDNCVVHLRGMFAFAIWDERNNKLLLARDRVGIKPLYYAIDSERLVFASEIKAVVVDPRVRRDIDLEAIDRFLTFMYVPGENTLLRDVKKLAPGHLLVLHNARTSIRQYWDLRFEPEAPDFNLASAKSDLVDLLAETVRDHMISDVPVGVLLSGGVDSTALLSFVVENTAKPVETFTVGFEGRDFADERPFARLAARTFGSRHHETTISAREFMDFLPDYVRYMEEPVCEPPAVALYYVSKLASKHVKVLLSGEGADEAFGGYQNYRNLMWLEQVKKLGWPVRVGLASLLGQAGRIRGLEKLRRYASLMRTDIGNYYRGRTWSPLSPLHQLVRGNSSSTTTTLPLVNGSAKLIGDLFSNVANDEILHQMLYVDCKTWLPDDLLVKADKMTMANSVELRVPFLDHRLLEFAAGLPANVKVRGLTTKYFLKKAFAQRIPKPILDRPKTGFPVPYADWFQKELHDSVWQILGDRRTLDRGYFLPGTTERILKGADAGHRCEQEIFSLLTLELWHRQFIDRHA